MRITKNDVKDWPNWRSWRKTGVTHAIHVSAFVANGEITIDTKEGEYVLPDGWDGYIAVDPDGDPYPIERKVFDEVYEAV